MYILGVSGWVERGHDASACLLKNGKIIAAAEEERFIRKKHAYDTLPYNAIRFCLKEGNVSIDDIDYVGIYWNFPYHYKLRRIPWKFNINKLINLIVPKKYFKYKKYPEIRFINHHLSHASSTFRCSGFDSSIILVVDGQGEKFSTSLWYGDDNKIKFLKGWALKNSLGYFYETVSDYVCLGTSELGKLMGLAAY